MTARAGNGSGWRSGKVLVVLGGLAVSAGGTGCCPRVAPPGLPPPTAMPPREVRAKPDHTMHVIYKDNCPVDVDGGTSSCGDDRRCLRARPTDILAFQARGAGAKEEFQLQFGPFRRQWEELTSKDGKLVLPVNVFLEKGAKKRYPFNVLSASRPGCRAVDPQIIIEEW